MAEAGLSPEVHVLKPVKATLELLKGYGYIIGEPDDSIRDKIDFYGTDVVVTQPADFHGNDDLCLNLVSFNTRDLQVNGWSTTPSTPRHSFRSLGNLSTWSSVSLQPAKPMGPGIKVSPISQT